MKPSAEELEQRKKEEFFSRNRKLIKDFIENSGYVFTREDVVRNGLDTQYKGGILRFTAKPKLEPNQREYDPYRPCFEQCVPIYNDLMKQYAEVRGWKHVPPTSSKQSFSENAQASQGEVRAPYFLVIEGSRTETFADGKYVNRVGEFLDDIQKYYRDNDLGSNSSTTAAQHQQGSAAAAHQGHQLQYQATPPTNGTKFEYREGQIFVNGRAHEKSSHLGLPGSYISQNRHLAIKFKDSESMLGFIQKHNLIEGRHISSRMSALNLHFSPEFFGLEKTRAEVGSAAQSTGQGMAVSQHLDPVTRHQHHFPQAPVATTGNQGERKIQFEFLPTYDQHGRPAVVVGGVARRALISRHGYVAIDFSSEQELGRFMENCGLTDKEVTKDAEGVRLYFLKTFLSQTLTKAEKVIGETVRPVQTQQQYQQANPQQQDLTAAGFAQQVYDPEAGYGYGAGAPPQMRKINGVNIHTAPAHIQNNRLDIYRFANQREAMLFSNILFDLNIRNTQGQRLFPTSFNTADMAGERDCIRVSEQHREIILAELNKIRVPYALHDQQQAAVAVALAGDPLQSGQRNWQQQFSGDARGGGGGRGR